MSGIAHQQKFIGAVQRLEGCITKAQECLKQIPQGDMASAVEKSSEIVCAMRYALDNAEELQKLALEGIQNKA